MLRRPDSWPAAVKVLFCCQHALDRRLGAPKVLLELADELEKLGWRCRLASDEEICPGIQRYQGARWIAEFSDALGRFIERHAKDFDIVDYDHRFLPFKRVRFHPVTLLVARVPLLHLHFETIPIPPMPGLRHRIGAAVKRTRNLRDLRDEIRRANLALEAADLINVSNDYDRTELIGRGFSPEKIAVLPLGMTRERLASFPATPPLTPALPRVAFVGTFDSRKGGADFPEIVRGISASIPSCRFRLLGAQYRDADEVLRYFPRQLRAKLEVQPRFEPEQLPKLLSDCSLGIFPSYIESFGFGVLEMLAASLPVVAYDAPGPPMMLPSEYLVPRGDVRAMTSKVIALLNNPDEIASARAWARRRALEFTWERAARLASQVYSNGVAALREPRSAIMVRSSEKH